MKKINTRINKYPYFLWLTYLKELDYDFENMKVKSDVGESSIKKVNKYWIFLIKYIPFVLLLCFGSYPNTSSQFIIFSGSIIVVGLSTFIMLRFTKHFIRYLFLITILINVMIYNLDSFGTLIDIAVVYIVEVIIILVLLRDILKKNYNKYYYLESVKKVNTVHLSKKHSRPVIPLTPKNNVLGWKGKGLFRTNRGVDINFSFSIGGYFIRLEDEN